MRKKYEGYHLEGDGLLVYKNRLYDPNCTCLKEMMEVIHQTLYAVHHGYLKMKTTTRKLNFWPRIKKDIAEYIARCQKFQQVRVDINI